MTRLLLCILLSAPPVCAAAGDLLPGFQVSPRFGEQVLAEVVADGVRLINRKG